MNELVNYINLHSWKSAFILVVLVYIIRMFINWMIRTSKIDSVNNKLDKIIKLLNK